MSEPAKGLHSFFLIERNETKNKQSQKKTEQKEKRRSSEMPKL